MRLEHLGNVLLDEQGRADSFDVDRHRPAVVGAREPARDVVRRTAALELGAAEMGQPIRDVNLLDRNAHLVAVAGLRENQVRHEARSCRLQ